MGGHERATDRARLQALRSLTTIGRDLRQARLNHDLSQAVAAGRVGISQSTWSRLERGRAPEATVMTVAQALSVVGLDLGLHTSPAGNAIRDAAHARLLERLRRRLGPGLQWRTEVPLPNPGDPRSWDAFIRAGRVRIGIEAETRARDGQELERRLALKRRDGGVDHVLLLLADMRHNRRFLASYGQQLRTSFPLDGREALRRLAAGMDPGGSAVILL
jgi:transcriptional regulator with XRE-family HTH domain